MFVQYLFQQGSISKEVLARALRLRLRPELTHVTHLEDRATGTHAAPRTYAETSPAGHYALLGVIGVGAMGQVWVGKDHDLRRKVAYKELSPQLARNPVERQRFVAEAQITAQLDHPNVPPVYALELGPSGRVGYAMKLVEGRTLRDWLTECHAARAAGKPSPVPLAERLDWFLKVCDAVSYAHSREVVHRDLKPDNVMIGPFGEVWVMDWGLARIQGQTPEASGKSSPGMFTDALDTMVGEAEGTPANMSPEQARGDREIGPASDQYALGLLLQELITLTRPVRLHDGHLARLAAAKGQREALPRKVPPPLRAIVTRACALDAKRRYASVTHLAADVRRYLRDEPVLALREGLVRSVWRGLVRNREWVLVAGFLVLVAGVAVALLSINVVFAERWAATARQERLGAGISRIGEQAHRIDKEILQYDRRLEVVAGAATQLLLHAREEPGLVLYDSAAFADPTRAPPDLRADPRFGRRTSHAHPVFHAAPGTSPETLVTVGGRLVRLAGELDRQADLDGPPLGWTFVGTEEGVHMSWPGHAGLAADFDPRRRPWYLQAQQATDPVWGAPYVDAGGLGLVVPCSRALRGSRGELLGVAGLDVPLGHVIDDMLAPAALPIREAWLLDGEGRMLVSSSVRDMPVESPKPFPDPQVAEDARRKRFSTIRRKDGTWYLVYHLSAVGWSYVVQAEEQALLAE